MVNQNPEPRVFTISAVINAGETIDETEITMDMGAPDRLKIYALYCHVYPGYLDIGNSTDFPTGRRTYTDIDPIYVPVLDNPSRENDSTDTSPFYVTLPLCCDPRPWSDIDFTLKVGSNAVPSRPIDLSVITNNIDKKFVFPAPVLVTYEERLYYTMTNNNPVVADWDTFTKVKVMLNGEVDNVEASRQRYDQVQNLRNMK